MSEELSTTEQVYTLIGEHVGAEMDELAPEQALKDDLNAAPEDFADLVESLEEKFGITIDPVDRKRMGTVGNIVMIVKDALNELDEE